LRGGCMKRGGGECKSYYMDSLLLSKIPNTVKHGYNDHGYNEFTVIANNFILLVWFSIFFQQNFMLITNKN
jgi:hypothetical protein